MLVSTYDPYAYIQCICMPLLCYMCKRLMCYLHMFIVYLHICIHIIYLIAYSIPACVYKYFYRQVDSIGRMQVSIQCIHALSCI